MAPRVLLVDDDELFLAKLESAAGRAGFDVIKTVTFEAARQHLLENPPDALVTNVRLKSFNGIHLAWLAHGSKRPIRVIVYADLHDPVLGRETQRAGAFYERKAFLPAALGAFLTASLPSSDRRDPSIVSRRHTFRGGRRAADIASLRGAPPAVG
jgi:DNA-binding NarL/FixJ family response regulator